jgi:uncharacterized heparinase superfamily protein
MLNAARYFYTLRYLRPIQVFGRIWYSLYRPKPDEAPPPAVRLLSGTWHVPPRKPQSVIAPHRFRFLNEEHDILSASDWNHPGRTKLWLYNLHYFDDLNAVKADERLHWHRFLIMRWVVENPPVHGNGWEPYPISLRMVNWIKWALASNELPTVALKSLAIQARFLAKRVEFHLLGNHLFANAKALIFAGLFFEGREADRWLDRGRRVLANEIPEQILCDGGHFELSPLYHSIILEDLLDLVNLSQGYSFPSLSSPVVETARHMLSWLEVMCHPDGQIALFNDAAFGVAPLPVELYAYAERLGIRALGASSVAESPGKKSCIETSYYGQLKHTHLKESGYIRVENDPVTAILDVGSIGPDYLPGHAHADTLNFELSLGSQRVIVDAGTSRYDDSEERLQQRGTAAHNTVMLDGLDSSEVWGSFRVARRARPIDLTIDEWEKKSIIACSHDGYRRLAGRPIHRREWRFDNRSLAVYDVIEGRFKEAVARFHLHPSVTIENKGRNLFIIFFPGSGTITCRVQKGVGRLIPSTYHPGFGLTLQNQCLEVQLNNNKSLILFHWS